MPNPLLDSRPDNPVEVDIRDPACAWQRDTSVVMFGKDVGVFLPNPKVSMMHFNDDGKFDSRETYYLDYGADECERLAAELLAAAAWMRERSKKNA